jgi:maltose-binding protein MalE
MKRRIISILVMVFVLLLLVAACNSSKEVLKQQNIRQAKEVEKNFLGLDLREVSSDVKIKLWEDIKPVVGHTIDQLIEKFQKENPNITVERTHMEAEDLIENTQRSFIVGNGPTLTLSSFDDIGPFSTMGIAQPLEGLMSEKMKNMYVENALSAMSLTGHVYGVPNTLNSQLTLFYNKKLVDKAPESWEELISMAKDVTKDIDGDGKIDQYGLVYPLTEAAWWLVFYRGFGGCLFDQSDSLRFNAEATKDALQFVYDLKFKDKVVPENADYKLMDNLFKEGKVAFIINGNWSYGDHIKAKGVDLGIVLLPKFKKAAEYAQPMISGSGYTMLAKLSETEQVAALKFIKFMTGKEAQRIFAKKHKLFPINKSVYQLVSVREELIMNDYTKELRNTESMPVTSEISMVVGDIHLVLEKLIAGDLDPDSGAAQIHEIVEKMGSEMQ